jgi:hypothetical protein
LAYSVGATTVEIASVIIARGFYRSIDANSVFMKGKRFYSLAAITWGLIAELQKETEGEVMRSMGKRRFELGAIKRILQSETFKGTIQCVPDLYPSNDDTRQNIYETAINVEEMNQDTFFNSGPPIPNLEKYFFDEVLNVTCKTKFDSFFLFTNSSYVPENEEISKEVLTETDQYTLFSASNITHISVISFYFIIVVHL